MAMRGWSSSAAADKVWALHFHRTYEDAGFVEEDEDGGFGASGSGAANGGGESAREAADDQAQAFNGDDWSTPAKTATTSASIDWDTPKEAVTSSGDDWGTPAAKAPVKASQDDWAAAANW